MSEPLSFLPYALAATDGRMDGVSVRRLVSAGLALLQRTPPLVRALAGRRAAILLPPSPAYLIALAASEGRGAVLLNPLAAPAEVEYQLADAGVGAVFTTSALAPRLPAAMPRVLLDAAPERATWVDGEARRELSLETHDALRVEGSLDASASDEEATVVYTSAMRGQPLGAIATHRNLLSNALATVEAARLTRHDRALALLPFSHLFGLVVPAIAPLLAGGDVRCMERFHPVTAIARLEDEPLSILVGVPAVFASILSVLSRRGQPLRPASLRLCICGGAPLDASLQDEWFARTGIELRQGYGLTEAGPVCLFNRLDRPNRRGSLGHPFPGVEVVIADPTSGELLADDTEGELWVRGDNVSPGYVGGREGGLERRDGWLRTGDLGVRSPDGSFTFRGLLKPMFTHNGFNVYPREVERVVAAMPGVHDVRLVASAHPAHETVYTLEVQGDVDVGGVRRWCEAHLAAYKQPAEIVIR